MYRYCFVTFIMEKSDPIKLRKKPLKSGSQSLYLDIYANGIRRYEFLKLYLVPELTKEDKKRNMTTLQLAEAVRSKRVVEYQNDRFGFRSYTKVNSDFYQYLMMAAKKARKHGEATERQARCLVDKMKLYCGRSHLPFSSVDKQFILGFFDFLKTPPAYASAKRPKRDKKAVLSQNSIYRYYTLMIAVMRKAVRDDIIPYNPFDKIHKELLPKSEESDRTYLTEEELKKMCQTETKMPAYTRRIFLFACSTGLRHSDIISLTWGHLHEDGENIILKKKQVKTDTLVTFPLSESAKKLLPPHRGNDDELVFGVCRNIRNPSEAIKRWAKKAGIKKDICFHTSRHTFATLALTKGIDLYTVSKLLGHSSIETTQIYAKVIDEKKISAIQKLPDFL